MERSATEFRSFYASLMGRVVRRVLQSRIRALWPEDDMKRLRLLGCGYAVPYLGPYQSSAERVITLMPPALGIHAWPVMHTGNGELEHRCGNLCALADDEYLPIETASIDRVLLIHGLEFTQSPAHCLAEVWRVLKSTGRAIIIVPCRTGLWSRAEWSPFGHGAPFSRGQLFMALRASQFVIEQYQEALYVPPWRLASLQRAAMIFERYGPRYLPFLRGLHIVEVSKQLYARAGNNRGLGVPVAGFRTLVPRPATMSRHISCDMFDFAG